MEWVETTGKTVDEAVDAALDQLGVDRAEADIEVLDEAKTGLFGRVRSEARIRARVAPVKPRAKDDRRDRKAKPTTSDSEPTRSAGGTTSVDDAAAKPKRPRSSAAKAAGATAEPAVAEAEGQERSAKPREPRPPRTPRAPRDSGALPSQDVAIAGEKFLSGLVEAFGLAGTVSTHVVADGITEFRIIGADLGVMIGPKAQTLTAIQDLLRTVVYYQVDGDAGRLLLDVGGYRERRRQALEEFTRKVAVDVLATGQSRALEPMNPADRKVVHDTAGTIDGIASLSEGEDAARRVVLSLG